MGLPARRGRYKLYEFFAGAGLARLGLGEKWRCLFANDFDPKKAEVYRANFGTDDLVVADVATISTDQLRGSADLAWASFPCQDLSLAGWQRGVSAARSGTFWAFWRLMRDLYDEGRRPPVIVLENVMGLLYGDNVQGLAEALAALGMQFGALAIDAAHFVPQSRQRVFIVAVDARIDTSSLVLDKPDGLPWFPGAVLRAQESLTSEVRPLWRWWDVPVPTREVADARSIIEKTPSGVTWHTAKETTRLLLTMDDNNLAKVNLARASAGRRVGFVYKRTRNGRVRAEVRFDGVAGCLRTPGGGSSRQTVIVVENGIVRSRLISPREAARLMGAPDSYILPSRYNDAYHAMGDAVVVPVVSWLSKTLLEPLASMASVEAPSSIIVTDAPLAPINIRMFRHASELLATQWEATKT